jgi:Flp pilus assembly protein TadD
VALSYDPRDFNAFFVLAGVAPGIVPCRGYQECFDQGLPQIGGKQFLDAALSNREAIRYDPHAADAWINLGWSLAQIGLDREAEQAFVRALALRPGDEHARNNLEWLRNGKGNGQR